MIFTLNISILRHNTEKKPQKNPQKVAKHLKMEKRVKQTIHTLDQHNYLVLSSGNLISIDSQGLYG